MFRYVLLDAIEDTVHIEVHDLGKGFSRVFIEWCSPSCSCIGEQDVDVIGVFANFRDQSLYL